MSFLISSVPKCPWSFHCFPGLQQHFVGFCSHFHYLTFKQSCMWLWKKEALPNIHGNQSALCTVSSCSPDKGLKLHSGTCSFWNCLPNVDKMCCQHRPEELWSVKWAWRNDRRYYQTPSHTAIDVEYGSSIQCQLFCSSYWQYSSVQVQNKSGAVFKCVSY